MTSRSPRLVGLVLVLSLVLGQKAIAGPIDFESLSEFDAVTNQFAGLNFSGAVVLSAGSSLNEFEFPPVSGLNVIFDEVGPMRIDFLSPISSFSGFFTYLAPLSISAYDAGNNLLGSVSSLFASNLALSGDSGSAPNEFLQLLFANMAYVIISGDPFGGSFTADDIEVIAAVPEPATLSLLLLGLGASLSRTYRSVDKAARRS